MVLVIVVGAIINIAIGILMRILFFFNKKLKNDDKVSTIFNVTIGIVAAVCAVCVCILFWRGALAEVEDDMVVQIFGEVLVFILTASIYGFIPYWIAFGKDM